jgi:hypothetical protein
MQMTVPAIEPDSPTISPAVSRPESAMIEEKFSPVPPHNQFRRPSDSIQIKSPPRITSLHKRNISLPKNVQAHDVAETTMLPDTTFDESAVGESTLHWLGMLPKPSYRIGQDSVTDRNKILGSYFHTSTPHSSMSAGASN